MVVSISIVVIGSLRCVLVAVPNDAREMFVEEVGDMPNSSTMLLDMKKRWAPSSKRIKALVFLLPATTRTMAVLSKQVVTNCGVE